jgi:RNA polymerase sigma-B factor
MGDDPDDLPLAETLGEEDPELANVESHAAVRPALEKLPPLERRVLMLRFFGSMTQTEIAQRVGVSQMQVSRILARTLAGLREQLGDG